MDRPSDKPVAPADFDCSTFDWRQQDHWTLLDTDFAQGQRFLACWQAWRDSAQRPRRLHIIAFSEDGPVLSAPAATPGIDSDLFQALHARCWGLVPGCHRLVFEAEQVQLTLFVGPMPSLWREWRADLDCVWWAQKTDTRLDQLKILARQCKPGAQLFFQRNSQAPVTDLRTCGFVPLDWSQAQTDAPSDRPHAFRFQPSWSPRPRRPALAPVRWDGPRQALIIGAGLAGANMAWSLAQRGWEVQVIDAAEAPAAGASGLPAGLMAPHVSVDDNLLSRLSRAGLRATWQRAQTLLQPGLDWQVCGVLRHEVDAPGPFKPIPSTPPHAEWSQPASAEALRQAGLSTQDPTCWHSKAGWIKPAAWVSALLRHPGIHWQGSCSVQRLQHDGTQWQALDLHGHVLADAPLVVVATALNSPQLIPLPAGSQPWGLQALRGQVTWGLQSAHSDWPAFALNGHGNLISQVPTPQGLAWVMGSSFERDNTSLRPLARDDASNLAKLDRLAPAAARLARQTDTHQAWTGVRCVSPDRLPLLGPVAPPGAGGPAGLYVCTALGSRGLTWATLCGELLAAALHGEPWPMEARLARALWAARYAGKPSRT